MEQTTDSVVCVHADGNHQEKSKNAMKAALIISIFATKEAEDLGTSKKKKNVHMRIIQDCQAFRKLDAGEKKLTAYNF